MAVSLTQIAASYNRPYTTTARHIRKLRDEKKFQKQSPGKFFDQDEVKQLEKLLRFTYKAQQ